MKIRHRKLIVFIVIHATLTVFVMLGRTDVQTILPTMLFNGVAFIGGAIGKDFIRSKWYQGDLVDK
jgi:hypothetical protein